MADPQPIEYELEDHDAKPPETEAEAVARLQREDEERARAVGLVREKHSTKTGKKWMDSIGGNSANATAARLLEQEARAAERQRQARVAGVKLVAMLLVGLVVLGAGAAVACDYMGVVDLGLFAKPAPEVATKAAERPAPVAEVRRPTPVPETAPKPRIQVLGVVGEATPLDNPPSEAPPARDSREAPAAAPAPVVDEAKVKRLERSLESAMRGVDSVNGDLAERRTAIVSNLKALYGVVPDPRDVPPDRRLCQSPCAMLELEQAQNAVRTSANSIAVATRIQNAQARVNNLLAYLKHDRGLEKDLIGRAKRAERERDAAQAALIEAQRR